MSDVVKRIQNYLDQMNSGIEAIQLDTDTSTSELAAQALGVEVGQIAKSLVFKNKDNYTMIVAAGDVRMDNKGIKELMGGKARMANAREVLEVTGYPVGGVCPFLLANPIPIFLDESLLEYDVVYAAAGTANSIVPITFEQLKAITGAETCRVSFK